jgi:hypothetical protein
MCALVGIYLQQSVRRCKYRCGDNIKANLTKIVWKSKLDKSDSEQEQVVSSRESDSYVTDPTISSEFLAHCRLFIQRTFLQSAHYTTNTLRDTTHITYINYYMFRHRAVIFTELLQQWYIRQPA